MREDLGGSTRQRGLAASVKIMELKPDAEVDLQTVSPPNYIQRLAVDLAIREVVI